VIVVGQISVGNYQVSIISRTLSENWNRVILSSILFENVFFVRVQNEAFVAFVVFLVSNGLSEVLRPVGQVQH